MTRAELLQQRCFDFALRVLHVFRSLPRSGEARICGQQLLRSATSVAANYRAVCRARSRADFLSKLGIVEEEADETVFWLECIAQACLVPIARLRNLISEAKQLTAIVVASRKTAKKNNRQLATKNCKWQRK
jgi:four helix bundle protein